MVNLDVNVTSLPLSRNLAFSVTKKMTFSSVFISIGSFIVNVRRTNSQCCLYFKCERLRSAYFSIFSRSMYFCYTEQMIMELARFCVHSNKNHFALLFLGEVVDLFRLEGASYSICWRKILPFRKAKELRPIKNSDLWAPYVKLWISSSNFVDGAWQVEQRSSGSELST